MGRNSGNCIIRMESQTEEKKDGLWNETSRIQDSVDDMIVAATRGSKLSLDG